MENPEVLQSLNEKQIEAVQSTEGYLRVIAGAGSGKTKLLVSRYAYLVTGFGIDPSNILCVTFTNKAAGEMKRRIRAIVGSQHDFSLICTYHGFCVKVLREDIEKIFYPKEFQILDTSHQKEILGDIYQKHELKLDHASFEKIIKDIALYKAKNRSYVAQMCCREKCLMIGSELTGQEMIIEEYMQKQKEIFAMDFNDLLYFTLDVFERCPEVLKKWQDKLNYIQVDEFQDSSMTEMELIDYLSGYHKNLMIVGDPDQNIYEWRGSDVKLLVNFDQTHTPTKTVFLNRNYRSTPQILNCANTLIDHNRFRLKKDLYTVAPAGIEVVHFHEKNEYAEADRICERIGQIRKADGARYSDFAVLYRSGFLSRIVEKKFAENGIPYEIIGSVKFYQRMEIQDIMAYLRLIAFDGDKAFKRIINTPRRKFGKAKIQRLCELQNDGETLYETLKNNLENPVIKNSSAGRFVQTIEDIRRFAAENPIADVVEKVCVDTGYERFIRELGDMERFENLAEFKRIASEYEKNYGERVTLQDFINQISLQMNDSEEENGDKVKLMTIHAAKGLEFPIVFALGFSEGIFPSSKTIEERKELGLEEERRLCYVAITRAQKRLYLLDSEGFTQNGKCKSPSRFLKEIGEDNYRRIGEISKELWDETSRIAHSPVPYAEQVGIKSVGEEVTHPAFGRGHILSYDEKRNTYTVKFDNLESPRTISASFLNNPPAALPKIRPKEEETVRSLDPPTREIPEKEPEPLKYLIPQKGKTDTDKKRSPLPSNNAESSPNNASQMPDQTAKHLEKLLQIAKDKMANSNSLWNDPDVPKTGWTCIGVSDLGAPVGICEMCCKQIVRYIHHMVHPKYQPLGVGCVCAGRMEGDPEKARRREQDFKNKEARRENFMKRDWKRSKNNNPYMKNKNHVIVLYEIKHNAPGRSNDTGHYAPQKSSGWKYSIDNLFCPEIFSTMEQAKLAAFEALEKMS